MQSTVGFILLVEGCTINPVFFFSTNCVAHFCHERRLKCMFIAYFALFQFIAKVKLEVHNLKPKSKMNRKVRNL